MYRRSLRMQAQKMLRLTILMMLCAALGALARVEGHSSWKNQSSIELLMPRDGSSAFSLSLDHIKKIMLTEVNEEFGERRLTKAQSDTLWNEAVDYEWLIAQDREEKMHHEERRTQDGISQGSSPFVVCDMNFGKSGESCKETVESHLGAQLIPLYNKIDMTCFIVVALPSDMKSLPLGVAGVPLAAEMKMAAGLGEDILTSEPMLSRIEAFFCASETQSSVRAADLAATVLEDGQERRLRAQTFLESRASRNPHRWDFSYRRLQSSSEDNICREMLAILELEVSAKGNTIMLTLPPEQLKDAYRECLHSIVIDLSMQPEVCYVGAYQQIQTLNKLATGIAQSGSSTFTPFYDVGLDGAGQVVALSDTGMDTDNCYFWDTRKEISKDQSNRFDLSIRKVVQYVARGDNKENAGGHGTHVAGTIAGRRAIDGRTESDGEADGVAKAAQLAFFDIGDDNGLRVPSASALFDPGYKAGARIHSASWGTPNQNAYTPFDLQIDEYAYENPDFLFIVAAGNGGRGNRASSVGSPALCKNGISVGASQNNTPHKKKEQLGPDYVMDFSSQGPTKDGRLKPDIIAPGQFILSAKAVQSAVGECDDTPDDGLQFKKGTSMAAPVVSATAALVRQYFEEGWHIAGKPEPSQGFAASASLVKAVLLNGAQELAGIEANDGQVTKSQAYDRSQGFGRVNLLQSLPLALKNSINGVFVNSQRIDNGDVDKYEVSVGMSGCSDPLSATLVWTDPPGSPSCNAGCVLNDLDLFVTKAGRNGRFFPNGLGSADTVNNVERVRIDDPEDGVTYTVHVRGSQLLESQDYSLVISGCFFLDGGSDNSGTSAPTATKTKEPTASPTVAPTIGFITNTPTPVEECVDGSGDITVSDMTIEDCAWLARNLGSFGFLCRFLDVALECPVTCDACRLLLQPADEANVSAVREAFSPLDGTVRWFGGTFDVQAKKQVTVRGFDIHIASEGQFSVQILTRPGKVSAQTGGWTEICQAQVSSSGRRELTAVPADTCEPVTIAVNESHTFYVTLSGGAAELILTDEEGSTGKTTVDSNDLSVGSGYAVTFFDQDSFEGFAFNGVIRYTVSSELAPQPGVCRDRSGTAVIDNVVGERSCAWLAANLGRFDYVCDMLVPSLFCPETCNICSRLV